MKEILTYGVIHCGESIFRLDVSSCVCLAFVMCKSFKKNQIPIFGDEINTFK